MPTFSDLSLEPREHPPAHPRPGELWVPKFGRNADELHIWSPRLQAWINLVDDEPYNPKPPWWRRWFRRA